jgi:hypothetical protein
MTTRLRHRDTAALIDRQATPNPTLDGVDQFLSNLRDQAATFPPPMPSAALAATLTGHTPLRLIDPDTPAILEHRPVPRRPRRPGRAKIAALAFASAIIATSGVAVAGNLPTPIQRATADLASHLGIHLPHPAASQPLRRHHREATPTAPTPGSSQPLPPTSPIPNPVLVTPSPTTIGPLAPTPLTISGDHPHQRPPQPAHTQTDPPHTTPPRPPQMRPRVSTLHPTSPRHNRDRNPCGVSKLDQAALDQRFLAGS